MAIPTPATSSTVCLVHAAIYRGSKTSNNHQKKRKEEHKANNGHKATDRKASPDKKVCLIHGAVLGNSTQKMKYLESTHSKKKHHKSHHKGKTVNMFYCPIHGCVPADKKQQITKAKPTDMTCLIHTRREADKHDDRQVTKVQHSSIFLKEKPTSANPTPVRVPFTIPHYPKVKISTRSIEEHAA